MLTQLVYVTVYLYTGIYIDGRGASGQDAVQEMGRRLKGTRMEVPPPFANLQASRGAERRSTAWQEEPGGGWRSAGVYGKIFGCSFYFHTRSLFSFTWELGSGWACLDQFLADRVEREETNWMKVKVS